MSPFRHNWKILLYFPVRLVGVVTSVPPRAGVAPLISVYLLFILGCCLCLLALALRFRFLAVSLCAPYRIALLLHSHDLLFGILEVIPR
jgi:hypothetical protein